jgi:hypothetical protein
LLSFICNANDSDKEIETGQSAKQFSSGNNEILLAKMDELSESLITNIDTHFNNGNNRQLLMEWNLLKARLNVIKTVRNSIIHSSGFVPFRTVYQRYDGHNYKYNFNINEKLLTNNFTGIAIIPNMVYVTKQGLDEMDALYQQLTKFLVKADMN